MKFLFALLQLFLIFQVALNLNVLPQDQSLFSLNGFYKGTVHTDGNFVLWSTPAYNQMGKNNFIWSIETRNVGTWPYNLKMQDDGNLVLLDANNKVCWSSNTAGQGKAPYSMVIQDDGNVHIYDSTPKSLWNSGTAGKK